MAAAAPWSPPDLGSFAVPDLWNALVSHLGARLPLRQPAVAVVSAGREPAPDAPAALVRLGEGAAFVASAAAFPFAALVGADLGIEDLALLPPVLSAALLDGVEASLLAVLPPHRAGAAWVARRAPWGGLDLDGLDRTRLHWFRAEVGGLAPEPALVDLGVDPAHVELLLSPAPRRLWKGLESRLTRAADDTLGRLTLPAARLAALRPGAVAVLDRPFDPEKRRLRVGTIAYDFARQGESWLCADAADLDPARTGDRTTMPSDDVAPASGGLDIGSIDVAVDFDLGRLDVPLSVVEGWQRGSLVGLPPSALAEGVAVTLRVNGRPVGTGDLVRIDGRVAVRLTDVRLGG